jgi:N-acetylglutamate synthase-like GNAT family acetyltransferase
MPDPVFSRLPAGGLAELAKALREAGLPADDLDGARMAFFRLADGHQVLGWAALEGAGPDLLLRSVLTTSDRRAGIGSELVRRVGRFAAEQGAERLWLLTETAEPFFRKMGFAETPRASAPPAIQETSEFRSVCPASATCMTMAIQP